MRTSLQLEKLSSFVQHQLPTRKQLSIALRSNEEPGLQKSLITLSTFEVSGIPLRRFKSSKTGVRLEGLLLQQMLLDLASISQTYDLSFMQVHLVLCEITARR